MEKLKNKNLLVTVLKLSCSKKKSLFGRQTLTSTLYTFLKDVGKN